MITDRDRAILEFLREYKFITLEQLQKVFFKDSKQGYNIARRRMQALLELGYVCSAKSKLNKKNVYIINDPLVKIKMPDEVDLILLNLLSELLYLGFDVKKFTMQTENKRKFGNGFARIQKSNSTLNLIIDVQVTNLNHNLGSFDFKSHSKVKKEFSTLDECMVLIVSDKIYYDLDDTEDFKVRQISTKLVGLKDIILS